LLTTRKDGKGSVAKPDEEYLSRDWVRGRQSRNVQWLQSAGLPPEGRLLDVGSAEGTFLRLFEDGFPRWQAQGVEPSADFSAFARSHFGLRNVATARLEDLESWPSEQFDLITINHVLEHLLNPDWFFSTARRMLKTGGHLFIDVPDAESESRGIGNLHIAHVYHFTMASLGNFLAKHGFEVVSSRKGTETPQWTFQIMARKAPEMPEQWKPAGVSVRRIVRSFRRYSGATRPGQIGKLTRRLGALASRIPRAARPRPDKPIAPTLPGQPDSRAGRVRSAPSDRGRRILVIVPNKLRDLEGLALTGFHLSRCYGHDVLYTSGSHVVEALQASAPDLLVMDHLAWDYRAEQAALAKRMGARLVLLPTSGLFQDASDHELIVGRAFHASKLIDLFLSWARRGAGSSSTRA
jgi:SAM-dependent methyltransferase